MKMMTRKCGIYAAMAAVLLVFALLITNCIEPSVITGLADGKTPVAKKTGPFLTINIVSADARTLMPTAPTAASYGVAFTGTGPSAGSDIAEAAVVITSGTGSIQVPEGTYTVTVIAYKSAGLTDPFAMGSATGVVVDEGGGVGTNTATISNLKEYTATGQGTLTYDFTNAFDNLTDLTSGQTNNESATLTFTALSGGTAPTTLDFTTAALTGTINVDSGFYRVTISMGMDDHFPLAINDALHIYRNMDTEWTISTAFVLLSNKHTITYDANTGSGAPSATTGITHGNTIADPGDPTPPSGEPFGGWWTGSGASNVWGTKWVFTGGTNPLPVLSSRTLYARWSALVTLALTVDPFDVPAPVVLIGGSINKSEMEITNTMASGGASLGSITISNAVTNSLSNFEWRFGDYVFSETSATLQIDFADLPSGAEALGTTGTHRIDVQATTGAGSEQKWWAAAFDVIVGP